MQYHQKYNNLGNIVKENIHSMIDSLKVITWILIEDTIVLG